MHAFRSTIAAKRRCKYKSAACQEGEETESPHIYKTIHEPFLYSREYLIDQGHVSYLRARMNTLHFLDMLLTQVLALDPAVDDAVGDDLTVCAVHKAHCVRQERELTFSETHLPSPNSI